MSIASPADHRASSPSDDCRRTIRQNEFYQLCNIQKKLEKTRRTITIDDADLEEFNIIRGADFDIDNDDPLDFEPRFFLPGSVEAMETALQLSDWSWPQFEPLKYPKKDDHSRWAHDFFASEARVDSQAQRNFLVHTVEKAHDWTSHQFCYSKASPRESDEWQDTEGRPVHHMFAGWEKFMWPRAAGEYEHHPDVPHAVATLYDINSPRTTGFLLKSELLQAVTLLKAQIRQTDLFLGHQFYPILILGCHSRFSSRIVQAHFYNGKMIVRPSRLLNMHTRTISPDVRLAIRWLNARPVGDTRWPTSGSAKFDEDGEALKVEDQAARPEQPVSSR